MRSTDTASRQPPPGAQGEKTLKGTVRRLVFRNPANGYTVLDVEYETEKPPGDRSTRRGRITMAGICAAVVSEGQEVVAQGSYIVHPKFGKQLAASTIMPVDPDSADGIKRYLGSGLIKGIGPGTAEKLVDAFGAETLEVIYREPAKLAEVDGIGEHKATLIQEAFAEQTVRQKIMQFLVSHRISPNLAAKIHHRYGDGAVDILTSDPYLLARDLKGVGFRTADVIATQGLALPLNSPERAKAGLSFALERASEVGHCFLPESDLLQQCGELLQLNDPELFADALQVLLREGTALSSTMDPIGTIIALAPLREAEEVIAKIISERKEAHQKPLIGEHDVAPSIARAADALKLEFSPEQEAAVRAALLYPLLVITGGPGCGKTTLIRALSQVFRSAGKRLLLAAPTGRAAQRMSQVCDRPASTIHRLLKFQRGGFQHGPDYPLDADCLIVDEASMLDVFLAKALLSAIPQKCTVVFVGDKDQLPSVGPGRVFADLIASPTVPTARLSQLFRRGEESSINSIAHQINSGIVPHIPAPDGKTKVDAYFLEQEDLERAAALVERLVADQIPKKFGFHAREITVLTPSNRGPLGVAALNERLQARINPHGLHEELVVNPMTTLRSTDQVVQRVNNYQIHEAGVFNGDSGIIYSVDPKERELKVDLWDGRIISYSERELHQLSLAYAITVHRSQGSEIPCVLLVLHHSHYSMLERQLVYTAVTRAKKLLIVVGTKKALAIASTRTTAQNRHTYLPVLLQ